VAAFVGANRMERVTVVVPTDQQGPGGGIVDAKFDNKPDKLKMKATTSTAYTVPLQEVFERYHVPTMIDYISLDVEGAEYLIMKDFPFDRYRIRVLTVERPNQQLVDLFYRNGYIYLAAFNRYGDETLFALKSEVSTLNLTVVETLHKTDTNLMTMPKDLLQEAPTVLVPEEKK
jgi:hypothetical protein